MTARRRLALGLATSLLLAALAFVVLRTGRTERAFPPGVVPVLVIPGYGGDATSVDVLAAALRASGRQVRVVALPDDGRAAIGSSAAALDRAVRATGAERIDVVGVSAGGVVARAWLADHGGAPRARHVVTLGSPHHGTVLISEAAGFSPESCAGACADLRPGSALLARLNAVDETPDGPDYVTFWTADDETVTPPPSATLAGARNVRVQDLCAGRRISHAALFTDAAVVAMTVAAATHGSAATFTC